MTTPDRSELVVAADGRLRLGETDHERSVMSSLQHRAMPRELRAKRLSGAEAESDVTIILATALTYDQFHTQTIRHHALFEMLCSIETEGSGQDTIWSGSTQLAMR